METRIQEEIRKDARLAAVVERATEILRAQLGPSEGVVTADWKLARDNRGRPALDLTVTDGMATQVGRLTRKEWGDPYYLDRRISHLWGDVLQERSHKQLARLRQLISELDMVGSAVED